MTRYAEKTEVGVVRVPGSCGCPRMNGPHCEIHDPRSDPEGSRAQRRAAKKRKRKGRG